MSKTTRATLALTRLGIKFKLHTYDYDPDADRIGLQAAEALGIEPRRMLKTLMAEVDGKPVCVVVPSDREVSMKKLAAADRGRTADGISCRRHQPVRTEEAGSGRDRPGGADRNECVSEWRTARVADRARSQRCRQGTRCDHAAVDGLSSKGRDPDLFRLGHFTSCKSEQGIRTAGESVCRVQKSVAPEGRPNRFRSHQTSETMTERNEADCGCPQRSMQSHRAPGIAH